MNHSQPSTLILGIGNLLWADEGFGIRMVEMLDRDYTFPSRVQLLDGGTQGLYLAHHVADAGRMLVFDAVDYGLPPGTLKVVRGDDVPAFMGAKKMSLHQTGFQEVLAAAQFMERYPQEVVLIGIQPLLLEDYGGSLTGTVRVRMQDARDLALEELARWGVVPRPRRAPAADGVGTTELALDHYEAGRPDERAACRIGDARFLTPAGVR